MSTLEARSVIYFVLIIVLAYVPYKPNQKKLFIGSSRRYAVLVSIWFCIFIYVLAYQVVPYVRLDHRLDWALVLTSLIWFVSPYVVRIFGSAPNIAIADKLARLLIRFDPKMLLTKYFEILFQQSMFVYILFVLLRGVPFWPAVWWFTVFIGVIHLGNIPFTGKKDALFYFYLSLPMSVIFGVLMLHGYVNLTITIHMLFYLVFNGRFWFQNRTSQK